MRELKKMIFSKIFRIYLFSVKYLFKIKIYFHNPTVFCIVDIDNTIANTWPTLISNTNNDYLRYMNLPVFHKMINLIKFKMEDKKIFFLFLSARNPIYFYVTKKWLKKNGFNSNNLILVPNAKDKLKIINAIPSYKEIFIYDDLSFNHENGEIKFYSEIISELKNMKNVNYLDYEYLKQFQN
jgi:hypothetical protein